MERLLITGGAGFIGSNFIHYMQKKHKKLVIMNYDKLTYAGNLNNLKDIDVTRYTFCKGDIVLEEDFKTAVKAFNPDAIVAFAAESHVDNSIDDPQLFITTNVLGSENILRVSRDLGIKKIVHISTDEVYGSLDAPIEANENFTFKPNSPYSASKTSGDLFCRAYYVTYGTPVTVIRGSNCYGPRQHPEKLIPKSITNLLSDKPVSIYGDGKQIREWIYTEDFCSGVETALLRGKPGEAYNLGGGKDNRIFNLDIACELLQNLNLDKESNIEYVADRPGHDMRYALNSNKLKALGWQPKYSLTTGLKNTVEWYKKNEWWWKPLI